MGKAKSLLTPTTYGKLGTVEDPGQDLGGISLQITPQNNDTVLRTSTNPTNPRTEAQQWQRGLYADADCFWRCLSQAQRLAWRRYYRDHPNEWINQKSTKRAAALTTVKKERKDLSERGLFMRRALQFDLRQFLEKYLSARWVLTSWSREGGTIRFTAQVVSLQDPLGVDYINNYARLIRIRG